MTYNNYYTTYQSRQDNCYKLIFIMFKNKYAPERAITNKQKPHSLFLLGYLGQGPLSTGTFGIMHITQQVA